MYFPFWIFCFILFFEVLFVCIFLLYYCYRVSPQLEVTNISVYHYTLCAELYVSTRFVYKTICERYLNLLHKSTQLLWVGGVIYAFDETQRSISYFLTI
jgi:hypothetical protein